MLQTGAAPRTLLAVEETPGNGPQRAAGLAQPEPTQVHNKIGVIAAIPGLQLLKVETMLIEA